MCVNEAVHDIVMEPTIWRFRLQGSSSSRMSDVVILGPTDKPSGYETKGRHFLHYFLNISF